MFGLVFLVAHAVVGNSSKHGQVVDMRATQYAMHMELPNHWKVKEIFPDGCTVRNSNRSELSFSFRIGSPRSDWVFETKNIRGIRDAKARRVSTKRKSGLAVAHPLGDYGYDTVCGIEGDQYWFVTCSGWANPRASTKMLRDVAYMMDHASVHKIAAKHR